VQGVFFRETLRRAAETHGVSGWARNRPDGTVEAVFEGEPTAVERLLHLARSGPTGAEVQRVDEYEETAEGLVGFDVS